MNKNENRLRRAKSTRCAYPQAGRARLSVHRTGQHIYAQVFDADGDKVLAAPPPCRSRRAEGLRAARTDAAAASARHRREGEGRRHRGGRVRPLRLPFPRPHQGAGRCGPRGRPQVLSGSAHGKPFQRYLQLQAASRKQIPSRAHGKEQRHDRENSDGLLEKMIAVNRVAKTVKGGRQLELRRADRGR